MSGTAKCGVCGKTAYPLESVVALEKTYHKGCFKCMQYREREERREEALMMSFSFRARGRRGKEGVRSHEDACFFNIRRGVNALYECAEWISFDEEEREGKDTKMMGQRGYVY